MNSKYIIAGIIIIAVIAVGVGFYIFQSTNNAHTQNTTNATTTAYLVSVPASFTAQNTTNVTATTYPLTIVDADGRSVTFTSAPQRIICCAPSITEDVFALNLSSSVVGVDSYSDYPPLLMQLENSSNIITVGGYTTLDPEEIAELNPSVVFLDQSLQELSVEALTSMNITVVVLAENSISDVENNLLLIGNITDHNAEALAQVSQINGTIQYVTDMLKNVAPVSVMELAGPPEDGMWSAGSDTYFNQVIQIAGGTNIFSDVSGWANPNGEDIISKNPQVVIMDSMTLTSYTPQQIRDWFGTQPGFGTVSAVDNNSFYILYGQAADAVERLGPRISDMILLYAEILHPDVFNVTMPLNIGDYYQN